MPKQHEVHDFWSTTSRSIGRSYTLHQQKLTYAYFNTEPDRHHASETLIVGKKALIYLPTYLTETFNEQLPLSITHDFLRSIHRIAIEGNLWHNWLILKKHTNAVSATFYEILIDELTTDVVWGFTFVGKPSSLSSIIIPAIEAALCGAVCLQQVAAWLDSDAESLHAHSSCRLVVTERQVTQCTRKAPYAQDSNFFET